ncbi:Phosphofructokinase family protein [Trichomonas vaginalis G3]|uniref:Phosphofructokinase family protein n=1 Tax=Trichomonas vaginalis (strain ATCC PRA-98 / G3) TaxID=412133 RepID=A2E2V1_TRIV3|nr:6-phosphofructokinase protein [Trichomonas vaginalis G3]EAY13006.1 Phosphofructokinase family protein [Trichomonas vaginalis G3]KAI5503103.1 6-phosphofructokinase protein [Trichomonas vaginalis G3]|eukprot:XP_001325229.1 Phosphofructokinase family protein [Trichomonas vaginalis G3]
MSDAKTLCIVVTGGTSPGVNDLISSTITYAYEKGWKVIGFHDGYAQLIKCSLEELQKQKVDLDLQVAQLISNTGGSYLRTSCLGFAITDQQVKEISEKIRALHINYFLALSGNENVAMCHRIAEQFKNDDIQVLVVAKTIDNDVPLPDFTSTFGFATARTFGAHLVGNLLAETRSVPHYFIIETMGKRSGHLASQMAAGTSTCLSIIPEDFGMKTISLKQIESYVFLALIKRYIRGFTTGIVIVSEALINSLDYESLLDLYKGNIKKNARGELSLDEGELGRHISDSMRDLCPRYKLDLRFCPKKIGYELRGAKPVVNDSMIANQLGCGVVEGFSELQNDAIVLWDNGRFLYRPVGELTNEKGNIPTRYVDAQSEQYRIIKKHQCYVTKADLQDAELIKKISEILQITPVQFHQRYDDVINSVIV